MRAPTGWRIICARSGVGPEMVVGLCVERSLEMIVGLSASSRPAAPICRSIPATRASGWPSCSTDAGAPVLVTQSALLDRLPAHDRAASCASMPMRPPIARQPATRPRHRRSTRTTPPTSSTPRAPPDAEGRRRHAWRHSPIWLAAQIDAALRSRSQTRVSAIRLAELSMPRSRRLRPRWQRCRR